MKKETILKLRKMFQTNTSPIMLSGQPRGKTISSFCLSKALVNSKNIHNRLIDNTLDETYKIVILIDCSGSRGKSSKDKPEYFEHILKQIIDMYYYLKIIVGKENLRIYLFNREVRETEEIIGRKIFSYSNLSEFTLNLGNRQRKDAGIIFLKWMEERKGKGELLIGNHDGYALDFVSKLRWWKNLPNKRKIIIHISDGWPHCDLPNCEMPGCFDSNKELEDHYKMVVKDLLKDGYKLCGLGVEREMDQFYGESNCIRTEENPEVMIEDFIELFSRQMRERRKAI